MSGQARRQGFTYNEPSVGKPEERPAWMSNRELLPKNPPPLPKLPPKLPRVP
jgi:hypothetical protein